MSGSRNHRPVGPFLLLSILAAVAFAGGCSTANNSGGDATNVSHIDASGRSVAGWVVVPTGGTHAASATLDYIATGGNSSCADCHGSNLSGGISGVSCSRNPAGCHHGPVAGWVASAPAVQEHGVAAKKDPGTSGFASCQICHGRTFSGGASLFTCYSCHGVDAPHPAAPWRGSPYTHNNVRESNAPVCAQCHFPGSPTNPANHPPTPAPAGTPPGCFNSTLCHGDAAVPHPVDNTWVTTPPAAQPHGIDAKAAPGATTGMSYCQACHGAGTGFGGGSSGVSCTNTAGCHGAGIAAPHPAQWRTGDTYVHASAAEGNAAVCAFCHLNGAISPIPPPSPPAPPGTAPGCFNGTLCHASAVPHPVGATWVTTPPAAQPHGNDAKAAPGATAGLAYCQACHGTGTDFAGGSSAISCYPCHGASAPHPAQWRANDPYRHVTADAGNAAVCGYCHTGGSNSPLPLPSPAPGGTPPGCFNSTLCHGADGFHPAAWPAANQHGPAAKAAPSASGGFAFCQTCHGTGTNFSGGISEVSCLACHATAPHPAGATWVNAATPTHRNTNFGNAVACALCHRNTNPGAPNCFNNTLCH